MKKSLTVAIAFTALLATGACSTVGAPPANDYGVKHYLTNATWPEWVMNPIKYKKEHPGSHYFVGMSTGEPDFELAREDSYAGAMSSLAQSIKDRVHTLFVSGRTSAFADHSVEIEKDIQAGVIVEAQAVATGLKPDRYVEREFWFKPGPGQPVQYGCDVAVLAEMNEKDYRNTLLLTLEKVKQHVSNPRAKKVVSEMKKLYLNGGSK